MSPRLLRFLLVYVLVGLTFTALASGATERVLRAHFDGGPGTVFISRVGERGRRVGMLSPGLQGNPHGVEEVGGLGASIIGGRLRIGDIFSQMDHLKNSDILFSMYSDFTRSSHFYIYFHGFQNFSAIFFFAIRKSMGRLLPQRPRRR